LSGITDDPRWQLAQRIADSRSIGRSPLLAKFLLHVCCQYLSDQTSGLNEQNIGVEVFGRARGYNSNDDNIVRNYARTLRRRIEEYFATEGRHERLRLEIPRGGYVPVFSPSFPERLLESEAREMPVAIPASSVAGNDTLPVKSREATSSGAPVAPSTTNPRAPRLRAASLIAALLVISAIGLGAVHIWRRVDQAQPVAASSRESSVLWDQLFQKDRDTFIVPADSGLVILQGLTRQPVTLSDYVGGSYRATAASSEGVPAAEINELGTRRYTSIVDLNLVSHFFRLSELVPDHTLIRYARDLRMDDLRSGNAVLLGSVDANPWGELFEQQLNFRFSFSPKNDASPTIINQHPQSGEQAVYANRHLGSWHNTFGLIAFLPNLDGTGHVLMIAGLNMAGTQAAGDFVLTPALMKPILDRARGVNGNLRPFEILIETDNVAANASRPHVVSERIGPT
jgi:hypothetical protein